MTKRKPYKQRRKTKWGPRDTETAKSEMRPTNTPPHRTSFASIREAYIEQQGACLEFTP